MNIPDHILALADRLRTQDNLATAHPIYCVQEADRIDGVIDSDTYDWVDEDYYPVDPEKAKELDAADLDFEDEKTKGYSKAYYRIEWRTVRACLTRKGAEDYLAADGHNLRRHGEPRIYVETLYRCAEMIALREWLMTLVQP